MGSPLWRRYSEYILFVHSEKKKKEKQKMIRTRYRAYKNQLYL